MSRRMKLHTVLLCLFLLVSMAPPSSALQGPYMPQTINGGPAIDVSLFGNRELYPGQTSDIQIVIQNSGVLEGLIGYETPKPYPVTVSLTSTQTQNVQRAIIAGNNSTPGNGTGATTADISGQVAAAGLTSLGAGSIGQTSTGSETLSSTYLPPYTDVEVNTGDNVAIAATTALGVTARMSTAGTPLQIVSSDCVVGGSLPAGSVSPPFDFILRVDRGARPGVYALPVVVTYKHLADQYDAKSLFGNILSYNNYVQESVTFYVYVVVREAFDLVVTVQGYKDMVPGSDGIVSLKVSNVGGICAQETVVYLMPSLPGAPQDGLSSSSINIAPSLVLPVQSSQYLGRMDPGDERALDFKVAISPDAEAGTYPLSALVSYTDAWGKQKSSNIDTFGVPVQPEMKFDVDDSPLMIKCGTSDDATLNITNAGADTAYDAVVRMNALDPFVVSYDTAYLGDVRPGDSVNTTFGIKVKSDAVPTTYYVTLEVKYYDNQDDPHVTKIIRKAILVSPPPTLWDNVVANWMLVAGVGLVALLGLLYAARSFLRDRRKKPPRAVAAIPEKR